MMTRSDRTRSAGFAAAIIIALALSPLAAFAKPIVQNDAATAAQGWLKQPGHGLKTPLGNAVRNTQVYTDAAGAPIYFVVNLNPSGFVIVPADDLVEPVLCFSPAGKYVASEKNPLGALVMRDVPVRLALARAKPVAGRQQAAQRKWAQFRAAGTVGAALPGLTSVSDLRVAPLTQSQWDQGDAAGVTCYNYYTPDNDVDGCVATAMAQLMFFYQYPTAGVGTAGFTIWVNGNPQMANLLGGNGSGGPYDWADMPLVPSNGVTTTQRQAIGALCYDAGVSVNMAYTSDSSGADPTEIVPALNSVFLYNNAICGGDGDNIGSGLVGMLNPNLDAGLPCLLSIYASDGTGHEIIADGYGYDSSTLYHHLNLGWGGYDTAWYNLPDFDAGGYDWQTVAFCIYNVYPTSSGEIISGRVTDSTGAAIGGVTVTATCAGVGVYTATTNANGIYAFANVPSSSSYTLTAAQTGYTFSPQSVSTGTSSDYATASGDVWGANFTPTAVAGTWTLTVNSSPAQGAAVTGTNPGTTDYSISSITNGNAVSLTAPASFVAGGTTYNFVQWAAPTGWTASGATVSGNMTSDATLTADYAAQVWTLTVNSAPVQGVGISGTNPGTADYSVAGIVDGTAVSLTAPASFVAGGTTYNFVQWAAPTGWTASGATVSGHIHSNATLAADYAAQVWTLMVNSTPVQGAGISGTNPGTTDYYVLSIVDGTAVSLTAPASFVAGGTTYNFVQWTAPTGWTASGATVSGNIHSNTALAADYAAQVWTLTVNSAPVQGVGITGTYPGTTNYSASGVTDGTAVSLAAPAGDPAGYTFSQWAVNGVAQASGQKSITFTMSAATTAVAQYTLNDYALTVQSTPPAGLGIGSSTGDGGTTDYTVPVVAYGTSVNLQAPATDPAGYTFSSWTLNGAAQTSGQKAATFTVTAAVTAVAQYTLNTYTLSVQSTPPTGLSVGSSTGNGGTTSYTDTVAYGTNVSLQAPATDPAGYTFSYWTLNGAAQTSGQKAVTFTVTAATTAVAQYTLNTYTLSVQSSPPTGLSVGSSTGNGGTTSYTDTVAYGTSVNLQAPATDPAGYTFSHWTLNGAAQTSGQKAVTFTMTAAMTAVAQYTLNTYTLSVQSSPATGFLVTSSTADGGTTNYTIPAVAYGASVNLQAPATNPAGYTFSHWTLNGAAQTSGQKSVTFTLSAAMTAVAQYTVNGYVLTVQSTPPSGVSIASSTGNSGKTSYTDVAAHGATVNLQAPATNPAGYTFTQWTLNGTAQTSGQKSITFTMSAAITAVARYALSDYALTVQSTPASAVSIGSSTGNNGTTNYTDSVASGTSVNLQAPATDPPGYTFWYWTVNGTAQTSGQKAITFTVTAATTAVARYTLNTYTLSGQSTPPTGLSIGSSTGHGGTTNYTKTGVGYRTSVVLQAPATDPAGYVFSRWTLNGTAQTSGQKSLTFTLTAGTTALATYTPIYTLSVQSTPPTGLSIVSTTGHGGTTNYTKTGVAGGTTVNLQAPATNPVGYVFAHWTLNGAAQTSGQKSLTFAVSAGTTAVATYTPTYTLSVQSTPATAVSIGSSTGNNGLTNYAQPVASGTSVNLQAPATDPAGYTFLYWTVNGTAQTSGQKAIAFTVTAATTAVARYTLNTYTLSVQSTPPTGLSIGSSTGHGGTTNYTKTGVGYGTKVSLGAPATDPAGYTFSYWTVNGTAQTSGQKAITFTLTGATTAVAQYTVGG
ncbi:MAG: C10 family peptidase [Candidatus Brocadiia bacterium]